VRARWRCRGCRIPSHLACWMNIEAITVAKASLGVNEAVATGEQVALHHIPPGLCPESNLPPPAVAGQLATAGISGKAAPSIHTFLLTSIIACRRLEAVSSAAEHPHPVGIADDGVGAAGHRAGRCSVPRSAARAPPPPHRPRISAGASLCGAAGPPMACWASIPSAWSPLAKGLGARRFKGAAGNRKKNPVRSGR